MERCRGHRGFRTHRLAAVIIALCLLITYAGDRAVMAADGQEENVRQEKPTGQENQEPYTFGEATVSEELNPDTVPQIVGEKTARERHHVERLYEKEENMNMVVFKNADETETMYLYDYPVKYEDEQGNVKDITLEVGRAKDGYVSQDSVIRTRFPDDIGDGISLSSDDVSVTMIPGADLTGEDGEVIPSLQNDVVTYGIDDATSLEYSLTYTGFKEDIVVSEYTGQTEYEFRLLTGGLKLWEDDGSYCLVDSENNIKAVIGDIIIFTADERNNTVGTLTHETVTENEEYLLTIHIPDEYLKSEDTIYPIRIDPSIEINYSKSGAGAIEDVTINSTNSSNGSQTSLYVGNRAGYGISRILMRFPGLDLSAIKNAECITSAAVEMRDLLCQSEQLCVYCYAFAGNTWKEETADWSSVNPTRISTCLSTNYVSYAKGIEQTTEHRYSFNITSAVQGWLTGNYNRSKGIIFKLASTTESTKYPCKTFASYNRTSYRPSLSVTYSSTSSALLANGNYYINNVYMGKYARYTLSTSGISESSGMLGSLGSSVQWRIAKVSGGYVIRPVSNSTQYLSVPTDTSDAGLEMTSIVDAAIPSRCKWTITSTSGGYLLKNVYNGKYLYGAGGGMYTSSVAGDAGTATRYMRTWRIVTTTSISGKELSGFTVDTCDLFAGETARPTINPANSSAIWSTASDFVYSGFSSTYVSSSYMTGTLSAVSASKALYSATVTATHKVTGQTADFTVVINPQAMLLGVIDDLDFGAYMDPVGNSILSSGYSEVHKYYKNFWNVSEIYNYMDMDEVNIFVMMGHGSTYELLQISEKTGTFIHINNGNLTTISIMYSPEKCVLDSGGIRDADIELSNLRLAIYLSCNAGYDNGDSNNIPYMTVKKGAETALGFQHTIHSPEAQEWVEELFKLMSNGMTLEDACKELGNEGDFKSAGFAMDNINIYGNPKIKLR